MHSIKNRFVIGQSNILSGGVYICTFQPGNFTGWGSEGVKAWEMQLRMSELRSCVKVEADVLGSPSLTALTVFVDVKQH